VEIGFSNGSVGSFSEEMRPVGLSEKKLNFQDR